MLIESFEILCYDRSCTNLDPFLVFAPLFRLGDRPVGVEAVVDEVGVYAVTPGEEEQRKET